MKTSILIFFLSLASFSLMAQADTLSDTSIVVFPEYEGGNRSLQMEVFKKFRIPDTTKTIGKSFKMIAEFVVTEAGEIEDIEISDALQKEAELEFIRVLQSLSHKFSPGTKDGNPVRVRYTLPLNLKIE